jgi:hypothetical protein
VKRQLSLSAAFAMAAGFGAAGAFADYACQQQSAQLGEQYQQLVDGGPARERADALLAQASRDQTMRVNVNVNQQFVPPEGAAVYPAPAGARSAYRWSDTCDTVNEEHILVVFGQPPPDTVTATPAAARAVVVEVTADADRIETTVAAIDFTALASIVE